MNVYSGTSLESGIEPFSWSEVDLHSMADPGDGSMDGMFSGWLETLDQGRPPAADGGNPKFCLTFRCGRAGT